MSAADAEDCELCDGCGEVNATTRRAELDQIGCPLCIERQKNAVIADLEARIADLEAYQRRLEAALMFERVKRGV